MANIHLGKSYKKGYLGDHLYRNPKAAIYAFGIFFTVVFFMGGGSRDDIQSLIILRPAAVLFAAFAIIYKLNNNIRWSLFPMILLSLLGLLMIIQLIPLPPALWTVFPERQIFADIADLAGIEQPWRPISLSPSKTWNSLYSLSVPLAAMLLFMNIAKKNQRRAITIVMALITLSASWGVLQSLGSNRGPLYLYNVTNYGVSVGLFANRNHQSFMLASLILFFGWYSYYLQKSDRKNIATLSAVIGGIFLLVPLVFITGSRSGLILMIPSTLAALYFFHMGRKNHSKSSSASKHQSKNRTGFMILIRKNSDNIILISISIALLLIAFGSIAFSRSLAFDRLFSDNGLTDLRFRATPVLIQMLKDYMPVGAGFGSFEHVYKIYEPLDLLYLTYFNHAHNDWLQFIIEGGLPAIIIILLLMVWIVRHLLFLLTKWKQINHYKFNALMCLIFITITAAASVGDYPLRTPIVMSVFTVILVYFSQTMDMLKAETK